MVSLPLFTPTDGARAPIERTPPRTVRVSLTDRCDLACLYCRPHKQDGYLERTLAPDEWTSLLEGLRRSGVVRLRVTGGEPLLSPHVVDFVRAAQAHGFEDLSLTTNATRLERLARPLADAGLRRINVSIDSLDPQRFRRLTRGGDLAKVLRGIAAAQDAGLAPLKTNTVVLRGENDDEIEPIVRFAWAHGIVPRFLEVMRIGEGAKLGADAFVSAAEIRKRIAHLVRDEPGERTPGLGPAKYVRAHEGDHQVGFITGTSDTYCLGCDRLRVAADGVLRPCLAKEDGVSAASEARAGDVEAIAARIHDAWEKKPDGRTFFGCTEPSAAALSIRAIGG